MRHKTLFIRLGIILIAIGIFIFAFLYIIGNRTTSNLASAECKIYLVHESDPDDSQFVAIDPVTRIAQPIGPVYRQAEFEGLEIHPTTGIIYTNTSKEGDLYALDAKTGERSLIGTLPVAKINSFSFHPKDYTLWAWAENRGLITIDLATLHIQVEYESLEDVKALTWNNEGALLYAVTEEGEFFIYNRSADTLIHAADNLPFETEGFSMLEDGTILASTKDANENLVLFAYDPYTLDIRKTVVIETPYFATEGVAWLKRCGNPL